MVLGKDDYVYVPQLKKYGRIVDIYGREETFYSVTFSGYFIEDMDFLESQLVKLESPYFPKGSLVTGIKGAKKYNFTTDKAIMEVIDHDDEGRILVKILKHSGGFRHVGKEHWVDSMWFHFVQSPSNFIR